MIFTRISLTIALLSVLAASLPAQRAPVPGVLAGAVAAGDLRTVDELLAWEADPDGFDASGRTPLIYAVAGGRTDMVDRLLEAKASPGRWDRNGWTPLMAAVEASREDMVIRILGAGADPNTVTDISAPLKTGGIVPGPASALSLAVNRGEWSIARRLFRHGADPRRLTLRGSSDPDPLRLPMVENPVDARLWKTLGDIRDSADSPDWDSRGKTDGSDPWILHRSARDGAWTAARDALDAGEPADRPDERGVTPLMVAAGHGNQAMVSLFLQRGTDPGIRDLQGRSVLSYAAFNGSADVMDLLLSVPGLVDDEISGWNGRLDSSPLYVALCADRPAMLEKLADTGLPADAVDDEGVNLLMTAAWLGSYRSVQALMPRIDGGQRDSAGRTALDWCAAAFDRDRRSGRTCGDPDRGARNYPTARTLASRLRNPDVYASQPSPDMHQTVAESWAPGKNPTGAGEWRSLRPSPVPALPGDGDLILFRIIRDEEPGIPSEL